MIDNIYHIQAVNVALTHFKRWVIGKMKGIGDNGVMKQSLIFFNINFCDCAH